MSAIYSARFEIIFSKTQHYLLLLTYFLFPISLSAASILPLICITLFAFTGQIKLEWARIKLNPVWWIGVALFMLVLLGTTYAPYDPVDPGRWTWSTSGKYIKFLLVIPFLMILNNSDVRKQCLNAFLAGMLVILAGIYLSIWVDIPWARTHQLGWGGEHTIVGDHITQSTALCMLTLVALTKFIDSSNKFIKLIWFTITSLSVLSITQMSEGRTGYLLLFVILICTTLYVTKPKWRWIGIFTVFCITSVLLLSSQTASHRIQEGFNEIRNYDGVHASSLGGRIYFHQKTLALALDKPLTGWGTGSYQTLFRENSTKDFFDVGGGHHPHNQYLYFFIENGIIGLVLFIAFAISPIYIASHQQDFNRLLLFGFSGILLVNSLLNCSLWSGRESHFFFLLLALLVAGYMPKKNPTPS